MKIALVTNIPAPYRIPIYEKLGNKLSNDFLVIFAARTEPNRSWNIDKLNFKHLFLDENIKEKPDGFNYVHNNLDVIKQLKSFTPDIVITTGFNPTHLYAWVYTILYRKKHIPMTDGTIDSEKNFTWLHRLVRKVVFVTSHAYIGASIKSKKLYKSYRVEEKAFFQSHLCVDNEQFYNEKKFEDRKYDLMFSGQFTERKLPFLFADIAHSVSKQIKDLKVLIIGDGPLKEDFCSKLKNYNINIEYAGFVDQKELPVFYSSARLLLFTTRLDPWGVVANEALASGTPVLVTPHAGVAHDLVQDNYNGYILEPNSMVWTEHIVTLLHDKNLWLRMSMNAQKSVGEFNFENAALGILNACEYAYGQ